MTWVMVLLFWSAPASAGKLDLDVYSSAPPPRVSEPKAFEYGRREWVPGDERVIAREPGWIQTAARAGYAGLGVAGLVTSIASGGVAPAVGFGIVSVLQLYALVKSRKPAEPAWKNRTADETN